MPLVLRSYEKPRNMLSGKDFVCRNLYIYIKQKVGLICDNYECLSPEQINSEREKRLVKIIRNAEDDADAKSKLMERFGLDEVQSDAILELRLRRLTGLERGKIEDELKALLAEIEELKSILASEQKVLDIIKKEMLEIKDRYGDERRTKIDMTAIEYIEDEALIPQEEVIVTITNKNYIKRIPKDTYKSQNRGGVGIKGMTTTEEDFVEQLLPMNTHDYIFFFSNKLNVRFYECERIFNFIFISKYP